MAFSWWQAGEAAGAGAVTGAVVGSFVPGLGTLLGAGIGALTGFIGYSVTSLFANAPTTTSNQTAWLIYSKDAFSSISAQSQLIADQEITQVNLLQQSQLPFTITAQKWEQVNYNENITPANPYQFYELLNQTGFLSYVMKLVGGTQSLWITEQSQINSVDQQLSSYKLSIGYNANPSQSVSVSIQSFGNAVLIVEGNVTLDVSTAVSAYYYQVVGVYEPTSNGEETYTTVGTTANRQIPLPAGVYIVSILTYSDGTPSISVNMNPTYGMALIFGYSGNSYTAVNWGFSEPTLVDLTESSTQIENTSLPEPSAPLPLVAEQIAVSMLGAAEAEYSVLKQFGYSTATQIPANLTLPALNLNIGNFSNFSTSIQAYNLYLSEYVRELLQLEQTLQTLSNEGKLAGLQQLSVNASNPLSIYGQFGGFIENGSILLPNGQVLKGLFLIQPYGGPLTLSSSGGTIGSGGAIAYQLVPVANGTYGLGEEYVLTPGTIVHGQVQNPGTLGTVNPLQKSNYLNVSSYQVPFSSSASSAVNNLLSYLESHPLVMLVTIFFVLILIVVIIRAIV
jgi:hypothetical protein